VPRAIHKLNARRVETEKAIGKYGDGGGLWLIVGKDGSKRWIFAWERDGKRREMGLGSTTAVSLTSARSKALTAREQLADGKDPIVERDAAIARAAVIPPVEVPLFGTFADEIIDALEDGWKNAKHRQQWRNTLRIHAKRLSKMRVDAITTDDVIAVLRPIWQRIPETAGRLRGRIERVLDAARAKKLIVGPWENPARWKGNLVHFLPQRARLKTGHHAAMPFSDLPDFIIELHKRAGPAARALELTILCATRTSETLQMKWEEVDLEEGIWIIPAARMKMGIEHRVPLSKQAIALLERQAQGSAPDPDSHVFPGHKRGMPLSQMAMTMMLRRMKLGHFTVHGMRSAFRDYMGEMTDHPETVVEQALAHQVGDATVRAYRRGDAFLKRRLVMRDWANFINGAKPEPEARAENVCENVPDQARELTSSSAMRA
jgi:integrase